MRQRIKTLFYVMAFVGLLVSPAWATLTIKANHDHIKVDYDYHGSTVSVSGMSDPGMDIVVKIASPEGTQTLMRKDKVAGFLWMNVDKLHFENIPGVYLLRSTAKVDDILDVAQMTENSIGYMALEENAELEAEKGVTEHHKWFGEFFGYKEKDKVYAVSSGDVDVSSSDGMQSYHTVFPWPYQAAPGAYDVSVYAVMDGKVVEQAQSEINVEQVGVVKMLAVMAKEKGGMYGVLAIIIALAAGFGVGMVFGKGGGAH